MNCSPLGFSVHEISQARVLEWVAISFSRGSSWHRDWTHTSCIFCIGRPTLYHWVTVFIWKQRLPFLVLAGWVSTWEVSGLVYDTGHSGSGEGNGSPLQYSCLENPTDRRAWWASVYGIISVAQDLATKPPVTVVSLAADMWLEIIRYE